MRTGIISRRRHLRPMKLLWANFRGIEKTLVSLQPSADPSMPYASSSALFLHYKTNGRRGFAVYPHDLIPTLYWFLFLFLREEQIMNEYVSYSEQYIKMYVSRVKTAGNNFTHSRKQFRADDSNFTLTRAWEPEK